jgi:hypothetical protein
MAKSVIYFVGIPEMSRTHSTMMLKKVMATEKVFLPELTKNQKNAPKSYLKRLLDKNPETSAIIPFTALFDLDALPPWGQAATIDEALASNTIQSSQDVFIVHENIPYEYRFVDHMGNDNNEFIVDNSFDSVRSDQNKPAPKVDSTIFRYLETDLDTKTNKKTTTITNHTSEMKTITRAEGRITRRIPLDKYHHVINIEALERKTRSYPLVVLGSIFGSTRLHFAPDTRPFLRSVLAELRLQSLVYRNIILEEIIQPLIDEHLGSGMYVGIHLRVGDGSFRERIETTVQTMKQRIQETRCANVASTVEDCLEDGELVLYVATDLKSVDHDVILAPLLGVATRLVTLNHIQEDLKRMSQQIYRTMGSEENIDGMVLSPLLERVLRPKAPSKPERSPDPQAVSMRDLMFHSDGSLKAPWIPLLDQLIASRGYAVLGTRGSTFSKIMEQLHRHFWSDEDSEGNGRFGGWVMERA